MRLFLRNWLPGREQAAHAERRTEPRCEMRAVCPASFVVDNKEERALLLDLSRNGAKFGTAVSRRDLGITPGQVMEFNVSSPFGSGACSGKVVWTRPDGRIYTWGVHFTAAPASEPFRHLLGGVVAS